MGIKLSAPILDEILPHQAGSSYIKIPFRFSLNTLVSEIAQMKISVYDAYSDELLFTRSTEMGNGNFDLENQTASFDINSTIILNVYQVNKIYKVTMCFVNEEDQEGYHSNYGYFKYTQLTRSNDNTAHADVLNKIIHDVKDGFITCQIDYNYIQEPQEKIYNYEFSCTNINNSQQLLTSGLQYYAVQDIDNISQLEWIPPFPIYSTNTTVTWRPDLSICTINNVQIRPHYTSQNIQINYKQITDNQHSILTDHVNGISTLILKFSSTPSFSHFHIIRRKQNETEWQILAHQKVQDEIIFSDCSLEAGCSYIYGYAYAIKVSTSGQVDYYVSTIGTTQVDFEDIILSDQDHILKIKYNPKVSSFKSTILETKIDTIGGKYPIFFRNGNSNYKEFTISGLISILMNDQNGFELDFSEDVNYFTTDLTASNFYTERQFKLKILDWLNNGQPKIFRSPAEGNYIIRLMNISLTPIDTLGRMLHTFNATAYEIADWTKENLLNLGYIINQEGK